MKSRSFPIGLWLVTLAMAHTTAMAIGDKPLRVLTYNVQIRPFPPDTATAPGRLPKLIETMRGYDIVVVNELFHNPTAKIVKLRMRAEYPYITRKLADLSPKTNGGVYIFSKTPFIRQDRKFYGSSCIVEDCLTNKGIAYISTRVRTRTVHVFATHMQAGNTFQRRSTRLTQGRILARFIAKKNISKQDLVIVAGDLNIPRIHPNFNSLLQTLKTGTPSFLGHRFSKDTVLNPRSGGNERALLDYILVMNNYFNPLLKTNTVFSPRPHPSDHFPVKAIISTQVPVAVMVTAVY